jgi:hypothetical protein
MLLTEYQKKQRGKLLAEVLQLQRLKHDIYYTSWGLKSSLGLYETARRILFNKEEP